MEPISITAVAIAVTSIFFTKAIEKSGENLGEMLSNKTKELMSELSNKSPKMKGLLEEDQKQPLQIEEAILEVKAIAEEESEIGKAIREIETLSKSEENHRFQSEINHVRQETAQLEEQKPTIQNMTKLAEKIGAVNQGFVGTQNNTFNF